MAKVTDPINIGPIQLKNRIVAAPLLTVGIGERGPAATRQRADETGPDSASPAAPSPEGARRSRVQLRELTVG